MEFTGERYVPGAAGLEELYIEHMSRYLFAGSLAKGRRVLDVGSGCGYGTHHLAAAGADTALGIDRSPEAVHYARRHYRHPVLTFAVMDASLPGLRGEFGLVTCFELIEHVEDAGAVLEGVRRALEAEGVFIVSTPNKATYVAGGEGGTNPFHVREYYREEFQQLLEAVFPSVRILGQHWVEGMALGSHPKLAGFGEVRAARLPEDIGAASGQSSFAPGRPHPAACRDAQPGGGAGGRLEFQPPYFVALCAKHSDLDNVIAGLSPVAFYGRAVRYDGLKEAALRLEQEFDRRGEWAKSLDREIHSRDETIRRLQQDLSSLRNEFVERGRWAARLNGELRQSGALVDRLAEENRRLREALAARRPGGRSKVAK